MNLKFDIDENLLFHIYHSRGRVDEAWVNVLNHLWEKYLVGDHLLRGRVHMVLMDSDLETATKDFSICSSADFNANSLLFFSFVAIE